LHSEKRGIELVSAVNICSWCKQLTKVLFSAMALVHLTGHFCHKKTGQNVYTRNTKISNLDATSKVEF
jgi:hypothetical protein